MQFPLCRAIIVVFCVHHIYQDHDHLEKQSNKFHNFGSIEHKRADKPPCCKSVAISTHSSAKQLAKSRLETNPSNHLLD